jgi:excisionase family DNA binding protein
MRAEEIHHFFERWRQSIVEETAERTVEKMLTANADTAPGAKDTLPGELTLLTLKEAAAYLKISQTSLTTLRKEGIVPTIMLGTTPRIDLADLNQVIQDRKDYGK